MSDLVQSITIVDIKDTCTSPMENYLKQFPLRRVVTNSFNFLCTYIWINKVYKKEWSYTEWNTISIICYTVLAAENEHALQRLLFEFSIVHWLYNMNIWTQEAKTITIGAAPVWCKTVVGNKTFDKVTKFNYLGKLITSSGQLEKEVDVHVMKTNRVVGFAWMIFFVIIDIS